MYITHGTHAFMTFWQRSVLVLNTRVTSASHSRASRACFQTNWGSQIWFPLTAAWWCCCCISYVPAIHTVTVRLIKSSVTDGEIDDATGMSIITRYTWTVLKHLKLELELATRLGSSNLQFVGHKHTRNSPWVYCFYMCLILLHACGCNSGIGALTSFHALLSCLILVPQLVNWTL